MEFFSQKAWNELLFKSCVHGVNSTRSVNFQGGQWRKLWAKKHKKHTELTRSTRNIFHSKSFNHSKDNHKR